MRREEASLALARALCWLHVTQTYRTLCSTLALLREFGCRNLSLWYRQPIGRVLSEAVFVVQLAVQFLALGQW